MLSVEITNHGLQIKKIPRLSRYKIHESRLNFFCIPESRAQFLPNPGSRRTPSRPWVKLRINITRVFRSCRNCPSRAATRAISASKYNGVLLVCYPYELVCTRMLLVCNCMYPYVTRMSLAWCLSHDSCPPMSVIINCGRHCGNCGVASAPLIQCEIQTVEVWYGGMEAANRYGDSVSPCNTLASIQAKYIFDTTHATVERTHDILDQIAKT